MLSTQKCIAAILLLGTLSACSKGGDAVVTPTPPVVITPPVVNTTLDNAAHLEQLTVNVPFDNGQVGIGLYIYADAPYYTPVYATGEGFTCLDDVSRAALYYVRNPKFSTDTVIQNKAMGLMRFVINMQSVSGYFYNFVQTGNVINKFGPTSVNQAKWWSWRAFQAMTEAEPVIRTKNAALADQIAAAETKLVSTIKTDLFGAALTTTLVDGITIPQWLPEGADQAATLILGLIPYAQKTGDAAVSAYIKKLADGILLMQQGGPATFPYSAFLSSGTAWHAYGNDQSSAMFAAGQYLNNTAYTNSAKAEVDNFYPWILSGGFKSSFQVKLENNVVTGYNQQEFEQIAYGIRPMVFAAMDAYRITGDEKYSDIAGHLAAWFLGNNSANTNMYSTATGVTFDALGTGNIVNKNSGAESTIEGLLTMQRIEGSASVKASLNKYKK